MLLYFLAACTKQSTKLPEAAHAGEPSTVVTKSNRATEPVLEALQAPRDSTCRGHVLPDGFDSKRCTIVGPYQGEINGLIISEELDFETALYACLKTPNCTGVSTPWYTDHPWVAVSSNTDFRIDPDSYGCTFVFSCNQ